MLTNFAVVIIGIAGAVFSGTGSEKRSNWSIAWRATLAFCIGALLSELAFFVHYYVTYGYQDAKLSVGITVSIIEFLTIALIGGLATCVATITLGRMAKIGM